MAEGISRQIERAQLILDVLQEDEWLTSTEIGRMFGLGRQAVTPYIQSLRDMGHDIESVKGKGHRMRERLSTGRLNLTQEELYALFLSISRSTADFPAEVVSRLKNRLLAMLSKQRKDQAKQLKVTSSAERSYFQDFEILHTVQHALETGCLLRVTYQGIKDAEPRMRKVAPVEFVPKKDCWYLVVYDTEAKGERHFRIDRISSAIALPEKAELPGEFTRGSMHPWDFGGQPVEARLKVRTDLARWLSEDPAHPSQKLEQIDEDFWLATYQVATVGKFIDWLMGLRGFELLEPEPLVQAMKDRAQEILSNQGTLKTPWEV